MPRPDAGIAEAVPTAQPAGPVSVRDMEEYTKAMLNILEDAAQEKTRLQEMQTATLNILADFNVEKRQYEETQRAIFNILDDFTQEREMMQQTQRAIINILEDSAIEKERMEVTQRALSNILEDFAGEKQRLEESQRAMINLLDDFDVERNKAEAANRELVEAFESLRLAKESADAANRELEAFSYSVSHDLRTPLQSIDGFSVALLEDYGHLLDETGSDYLRRVRNASQRMGQLIEDLLRLSRLTRSVMNPARVDLSAVSRAVIAELRRMQPERVVSFRVTEGLEVIADPNLLKIAMDNLIGNAWKFTSKKSEAVIEVGATEIEGKTAYFVRDNGAGFDMAYSKKLFATFQRLHLEKDYPGTGIGLSLVQRIIHRHNGVIWAEGAIGEGATFYFTLNLQSTELPA